MIADFVGFHPDGGFLGTSAPSWITEFPFMTTIDALVLSYGPLPAFDWVTPEALAFVLEAGQYYHSLNSEFPSYNLTELEICVLPWQTVQNQLTQAGDSAIEHGLLWKRLGVVRSLQRDFVPGFEQSLLDERRVRYASDSILAKSTRGLEQHARIQLF